MYPDDHSDWLPPNPEGRAQNVDGRGWVSGLLDFNGANTDNTNITFLSDPQYAKLAPYNNAPGIYKCPADQSAVKIRGQRHARVRSIAMNQAIGWNATASWVLRVGSDYRIMRKLGDVRRPSLTFGVGDEHPDSINGGGVGGATDRRPAPGVDHRFPGELPQRGRRPFIRGWTRRNPEVGGSTNPSSHRLHGVDGPECGIAGQPGCALAKGADHRTGLRRHRPPGASDWEGFISLGEPRAMSLS